MSLYHQNPRRFSIASKPTRCGIPAAPGTNTGVRYGLGTCRRGVRCGLWTNMPTFTSKQPDPAPLSTPPTADQKTRKPKGHIGEPSPYRDQVGTVQQEGEATHCSFSGPIKLEAARWLESKVQEVQCSTCGSVSKARLKEQSVVISPHPPRKSRPVRNVTRRMEQERDWVLVQKKEMFTRS